MSTDNSTFFKILIAIDCSEKSLKAAEYAINNIAINQKPNVQLIAVTVIELVKLNLSTFITAPTFGLKDLEDKRNQAKKSLNNIEKLIQQKGKNIEFKSYILEDPTLSKLSNNKPS